MYLKHLGISLFDLATTDKIGRDRIFEESIRAAERRIINKEITVLRKLQNYLLKDMSPESDLIFDQLIIQLQKELVDSEVSDHLEVIGLSQKYKENMLVWKEN